MACHSLLTELRRRVAILELAVTLAATDKPTGVDSETWAAGCIFAAELVVDGVVDRQEGGY